LFFADDAPWFNSMAMVPLPMHLLFIVLVLQLHLFVGGFLDGGEVSSLLLKVALLLALFLQFGSLVGHYLE
jgi:hypothetical protein